MTTGMEDLKVTAVKLPCLHTLTLLKRVTGDRETLLVGCLNCRNYLGLRIPNIKVVRHAVSYFGIKLTLYINIAFSLDTENDNKGARQDAWHSGGLYITQSDPRWDRRKPVLLFLSEASTYCYEVAG